MVISFYPHIIWGFFCLIILKLISLQKKASACEIPLLNVINEIDFT